MTAQHLAADDPFYQQWADRGGLPRTLESSDTLAQLLEFTPPPSIAVVGSKGKGTTAAALSMTLANAGLRIVSITSPAFRTNRERIRLNGTAISLAEYEELSERLSELLPLLPSGHYLSPTGAYPIMGAWWASEQGADVLVVEEGMGGKTDEVSLFSHVALAVTPIFFEHGGILGQTVPQIADNLVSAGSESVQIIASAPQSDEVKGIIAQRATEWNSQITGSVPAPHRNPLIGQSIGLGQALGKEVAKLLGGSSATHEQKLDQNQKQNPGLSEPDVSIAGSLVLPGRSSLHHVQGIEGQPDETWFVDAAISADAVRVALESAGMKDAKVVCSWPLSKDRTACLDLVPGAIEVRAGQGLEYPDGLPTLEDVASSLAGDVIALGTISFIAEVLEHVGAETDSWLAS